MPKRSVLIVALAVVLAGCTTVDSPRAEPEPTPSAASVTFAAADGVTLTGRLHGTGTTAVVLSNMGDNDPSAWERFAPALTAKGYLVLTFAYRYPERSPSLTAPMAKGAVEDLRGAVAFVRAQGARRVILVGASLGGMLTAKVSGGAQVDAIAIVSAPADRPDFDLRVDAPDLAIAVPKLFVASDNDANVPPAQTRALYEMAREPKSWHTYPSAAHGTQLLDTPLAADFQRLLLDFIMAP